MTQRHAHYIVFPAIFLAMTCLAQASEASTLLFEGQNVGLFPSANPNSITTLMNSVRRPTDPSTAAAAQLSSPSSIIAQSVESQISNQINNILFNNKNPSGTFNLGGGNIITFQRTGGNLNISIDSPTGNTQVSIPDL